MRARIRLCCGLSPVPSETERDAGGLHVRQEHRVVHVPFRRGPEAHGVAVHEREAVHRAGIGIDASMTGEHTRKAIWAQSEWLRMAVPTDKRLPDSRILFTGCGTSFHAAQTGGDAVQALELVLRSERDADVLVAISHEGTTKLTLEAVQAWPGEKWVVTGAPESPIAPRATTSSSRRRRSRRAGATRRATRRRSPRSRRSAAATSRSLRRSSRRSSSGPRSPPTTSAS